MGQSEIFELLKSKRLGGDDSHFSVQEVRKMLNDKGLPNYTDKVSGDLKTLWYYGFLEIDVKDKRGYRIKSKYV